MSDTADPGFGQTRAPFRGLHTGKKFRQPGDVHALIKAKG